ncbi:acyl-CoA thioesterase [Actinomadura graeca]|uniref:Acyl-CoA thioesterase n=1 Tax=Actinomadura graeca TaxID=2750812 RepID=A0ABX8QUH0_9ACTN|nr:thioesterase family protein [Actinomadura graeca]QXJ21382.1 acyl-CoA thioesterase [Actinomadura graeca]
MAEHAYAEDRPVVWADTDAGGRVHWSAVFRWAEAAEHAFLRTLGWDPGEAGTYPRRSAEAAYHRPQRFGQRCELRLDVERVKNCSVTFGWTVVCEGRTCAAGRHTVVHVNEDDRPAPWPDHLRTALVSAAAARRAEGGYACPAADSRSR